MCAIAGAFGKLKSVVGDMAARLAHRGPDGQGVWSDFIVALAARRLAVLDPKGSEQPMKIGDHVIVYNGEVYNFLELRAELRALGHEFTTDGDTEVVLRAYQQWGFDCLGRFNGMWALAIWDCRTKLLWLARDRLGIKPLYYAKHDGEWTFASEMKAFGALPGFVYEYEPDLLARLVLNPTYQETEAETGFRNIWRLRPGHWATITESGDILVHRWWVPADHLPTMPASKDAAITRFRDLIDDACMIRLRSDAPTAVTVSGGLDSSSVAASIIRLNPQGRAVRLSKLRFYTLGGRRTHKTAALAIQGFKAAHRNIEEPDYYNADTIMLAMETPCRVHPGHWMLYKGMADHGVKVSIDGHGPDETLAGYAAAAEYTDRHPFEHSFEPPTLMEHPSWEAEKREVADRDPLFKYLYFTSHYGVLQWILKCFDMASMAHGIESRAPFLDYRVFYFMLAMPSQCKIDAGMVKAPLRWAMRDRLPPRILWNLDKRGLGYSINDQPEQRAKLLCWMLNGRKGRI